MVEFVIVILLIILISWFVRSLRSGSTGHGRPLWSFRDHASRTERLPDRRLDDGPAGPGAQPPGDRLQQPEGPVPATPRAGPPDTTASPVHEQTERRANACEGAPPAPGSFSTAAPPPQARGVEPPVGVSTRPAPSVVPIGKAARRRPPEDRRREEIRGIVRRRGIERLVHFTPRDNLVSIGKLGLLARSELEECRVPYRYTDPLRLDGRSGWISLSISFPNFKMFYNKRQSILDVGDWVVLDIDPRVLWELDCLFFSTNAASKCFHGIRDEELRSPAALENMFAGTRSPNLRACDPSDPQAEILVRSPVPREYLRSVFVNNKSEHGKFEHGFRLSYDPAMFDKRHDHRNLH